MADGVWKGVQFWVIVHSKQLLLNRFFDPSTPCMRKGHNEEKNGEKNGENSGTLPSLPVDQLQRLCQKQAQYLCRVGYAYIYSTSKSERMLMKKLLIISAVFNAHTFSMFWPQFLHN